MSTSAAVATGMAASAQIEAHQAKVIACKAFVPGYRHDTATTAEAREYAECIETLYPRSFGLGDAFAIKVVFVVALIGMAFGAWKGWNDDGPAVAFLGAVLGFIGAPCVLGFLFVLYKGTAFLFS